jgi:hypothetical protein
MTVNWPDADDVGFCLRASPGIAVGPNDRSQQRIDERRAVLRWPKGRIASVTLNAGGRPEEEPPHMSGTK